ERSATIIFSFGYLSGRFDSFEHMTPQMLLKLQRLMLIFMLFVGSNVGWVPSPHNPNQAGKPDFSVRAPN
ncbi:MAG TPA: hypothetical protein VLZ28_07680, partial [Daejeonella sp.]|nr:hypothetical protein [Daejeonella sp.]